MANYRYFVNSNSWYNNCYTTICKYVIGRYLQTRFQSSKYCCKGIYHEYFSVIFRAVNISKQYTSSSLVEQLIDLNGDTYTSQGVDVYSVLLSDYICVKIIIDINLVNKRFRIKSSEKLYTVWRCY